MDNKMNKEATIKNLRATQGKIWFRGDEETDAIANAKFDAIEKIIRMILEGKPAPEIRTEMVSCGLLQFLE